MFGKQIWHWLGRITGRPAFEPLADEDLGAWCTRQDTTVMDQKSTRAKCLLTMWMLWKHRNDVVFNGVAKAGLLKKGTDRLEVEVDRWAIES